MPLISVEQAAAIIEVGECRVRQLIRADRLPAVKYGRFYLIEERTARKFAKQARRPGRPKSDKAKDPAD